MAARRAAVIGSGFGGLALAVRLQAGGVETTLINGLWWGEIDGPEDLHSVRADLSRGESKPLEPTRFAAART